MYLDENKLDEIRIMLIGDDQSIEFSPIKENFEKDMWIVYNKEKISLRSHNEEKYDFGIKGSYYSHEFLGKVNGVDLRARIFIHWEGDEEKYDIFDDYNELAKCIGVSNLVAVSSKIPQSVERKFRYFIQKEGKDKSTKIRELIYGFTKHSIEDNAEELMFKDTI